MSTKSDPVLDNLLDKAPKQEKRWKNRYLVVGGKANLCIVCGEQKTYNIGDDFVNHCLSWPTEKEARLCFEQNMRDYPKNWNFLRYLGPIQID